MYGGIEAGGTKFICAVADEKQNIIEKISIPTTVPENTMKKVFEFFDQYSLKSIGIGSFGPIDVNSASSTYGYIMNTPKEDWINYDLWGIIQEHYQIPVAWTTDVNAAAYGEFKKGAAQGVSNCVYLTIGTGIGGGVIINGEIFQGKSHPEMGHIKVKRVFEDDCTGTCIHHQDCLEGLAAGPSLEARTGIKGEMLPKDHKVWKFQANYIAQALVNYTLTLCPEKIILGGGVMNQEHLLEKIKEQFVIELADYVSIDNVDDFIVPWGLPNQSGIIGALLLAEDVYKKRQ